MNLNGLYSRQSYIVKINLKNYFKLAPIILSFLLLLWAQKAPSSGSTPHWLLWKTPSQRLQKWTVFWLFCLESVCVGCFWFSSKFFLGKNLLFSGSELLHFWWVKNQEMKCGLKLPNAIFNVLYNSILVFFKLNTKLINFLN